MEIEAAPEAAAGNPRQQHKANFSTDERTWFLYCLGWARDNDLSAGEDLDSDTLNMAREFVSSRPNSRVPSAKALKQLWTAFKTTGSAKRLGKRGRKKREVSEEVELLLKERNSVRTIRDKLGVSVGLIMNIARRLHMRFYRRCVAQVLTDDHITRRYRFALEWHRSIETGLVDVHDICFTDECIIGVGPSHNRQNDGIWYVKGEQDIDELYLQRPHRGPKVHMFVLIHARIGLLGPYFIDEVNYQDGRTKPASLNSKKYIILLRDKVFPDLMAKMLELNLDFAKCWFQQDGAPCHTSLESREFLRDIFGDRIISNKELHEWPPNSPDLNPLDYNIWSELRKLIGRSNPTNADEIKRAARLAAPHFTQELIRTVVDDFPVRIRALREARGRHFEGELEQFKRRNRPADPPVICPYCERVHACTSCQICTEICNATMLASMSLELD